VPHPDGYAYAVDLIQGIRSIGDFEISVGCYPEGHPASPRLETDIDILKGKADAGATRAITQFVFDWQVLVRFRDTVRQRGLTIPIVPGIMPVGNFRGVTRFAKACGATIPEWLTQRFEGLEGKPDELKRAAVDVACAQIAELRRHGFDKFHFYTLNRAELTEAVVKRIQLSPNQPIQEVQHDTR
jgi:methylenetetrahydrofolate reductase (NADPH)